MEDALCRVSRIDGQVFWVEVISKDGKVCQIAEPDARCHPDVKKLPSGPPLQCRRIILCKAIDERGNLILSAGMAWFRVCV